MDYLLESVKTVENLCIISKILIEVERRELLPTVLEFLHQETQHIIDDYCVVESVADVQE